MRIAKVLISGLLAAALMSADTAVLECMQASPRGTGLLLSFRRPPEGRFESATLVLHLREDGAVPEFKVNGRAGVVRSRAKGWITVVLPVKEVAKPVRVDPAGFFDLPTREGFAPYLVLDSTAARPAQ